MALARAFRVSASSWRDDLFRHVGHGAAEFAAGAFLRSRPDDVAIGLSTRRIEAEASWRRS